MFIQRLFSALCLISVPLCSFSATRIDAYGVPPQESAPLIKRYWARIEAIETKLTHQLKEPNFTPHTQQTIEKLLLLKQQLIQDIQQSNHYAYVNFESVIYPRDSNQYITIELIKPDQANRLRWITPTTRSIHFEEKNDIINEMIQYTWLVMRLQLSNQINPLSSKTCPVYHCLDNFEDPRLKPYLPRFNEAMIKERQLILNTLKKDPNPERRMAAVFFLGHSQNANDIITQLLPYITDSNDGVRNNALRVISATLSQIKHYPLDLRPFITLLRSPYDSDRNKSLSILATAIKTKPIKSLQQRDLNTLIDLLALKQPNNHDYAYQILKQLSQHDFGEYRIADWRKWAATQPS